MKYGFNTIHEPTRLWARGNPWINKFWKALQIPRDKHGDKSAGKSMSWKHQHGLIILNPAYAHWAIPNHSPDHKTLVTSIINPFSWRWWHYGSSDKDRNEGVIYWKYGTGKRWYDINLQKNLEIVNTASISSSQITRLYRWLSIDMHIFLPHFGCNDARWECWYGLQISISN